MVTCHHDWETLIENINRGSSRRGETETLCFRGHSHHGLVIVTKWSKFGAILSIHDFHETDFGQTKNDDVDL